MGAPASYHQRQGLRQPTAARFPSTCRRVDARHRQGHHCACYIERIRPNLVSYRPASSIPQGPHAGTCLPASNNGAPGCRKAGRVSRIRQGSALHCTCTVPWNIQASPSSAAPYLRVYSTAGSSHLVRGTLSRSLYRALDEGERRAGIRVKRRIYANLGYGTS